MNAKLSFNGKRLPREEAREQWLAQVGHVRCICGLTASYGEKGRDTIGGTVDGIRAVWLGCPRCKGTVGSPLVGNY